MTEDILDLPPPPADVRLRYGLDGLQFGDLRLPAGEGPHPVVIYIHGGFWRSRYDLGHASHPCAALTAVGIATWNIEYRRIGNPGGAWPGTFEDVAAAADHIRTLAPHYNLDLQRVVAAGHSAGGHLALWLAARRRIPSGAPLHHPNPLPLRGVVSLAGVVDLREAWNRQLSSGVVCDLIGGGPDEVPERYAATSPPELLPLRVPQILIHGTRDDSVPYEISSRYHESAVATGDDATLVTLPGAGHFALVDPRTREWQQTLAAVQRMLGGMGGRAER